MNLSAVWALILSFHFFPLLLQRQVGGPANAQWPPLILTPTHLLPLCSFLPVSLCRAAAQAQDGRDEVRILGPLPAQMALFQVLGDTEMDAEYTRAVREPRTCQVQDAEVDRPPPPGGSQKDSDSVAR